MQAIISPGKISGTLTPPASKSLMQRACAAALLHNGTTISHNPGISDDDKAALRIVQQLGASVDCAADNSIIIKSNGIRPVSNSIDCGESGLSARLFIPIASMHTGSITVNGHGSLLNRPFDVYADVLPQLGVQVTGSKLPMMITGPVQPKNITIDGSISSQFLSGLLFAFAYSATEPVVITVNRLNSKPYIDMTLDVLRTFGKKIHHEDYHKFYINPQTVTSSDIEINIEADWSAAANFIIAKAIGHAISINNLNPNSLQADRAILQVVNEQKTAFNFDATDCPDLIPILSVYAAYCSGTSTIQGMNRLVHKESNRIESTTAMLHTFGITYSLQDDMLEISGGKPLQSCTINGYNDHRIVMAAAIAALGADEDVTINDAQAVAKSYPDFFKHLSSLGAKCILKDE
ncbi:MAG TPA: 3-phosphoshikimate 1-carboxyvinyltransferase [Flavipsychrobacter sp.]